MIFPKSIFTILNRRRKAILFPALLAVFLSACSGGPSNLSWPGLAVQGETAFLAHNSFISAVNLSTGGMVWKYPPEAVSGMLFYGDPIVDSQGRLVAGSYNGSVVQLQASNGNPIWKYDGKNAKIIAPVAEGPGGNYYASLDNGDLLIIDPSNGSLKQTVGLDRAASWGGMAVDDQHLYVATLEHVLFAVGADGTILWKKDLGIAVAGGVALVDGDLLAGTFNNKVQALDPADGSLLWDLPADGWVWNPPAVADGVAYFADLAGTLQAVSLKDRTLLWKATLDSGVQAAPVVGSGRVYVGTQSGTVRAFSAKDGAPQWEQKLEGGVFGTMRLAGSRLLVVVNSGPYQLAALSVENGTIIWKYIEPTT